MNSNPVIFEMAIDAAFYQGQPLLSNALGDSRFALHSDASVAKLPLGFQKVFDQLRALWEDDSNFDSECLRPTNRAVSAFCVLLANAAIQVVIPEGNVYPDGEGGIRVEWRNSDLEQVEYYILLRLHASDERQDYVYYQRGSRRGSMDKNIDGSLLSQRLRWLSGQIK